MVAIYWMKEGMEEGTKGVRACTHYLLPYYHYYYCITTPLLASLLRNGMM